MNHQQLPWGVDLGQAYPKLQPCARLHNRGQQAQDRLLGDRTQVLVPNPLPAEQHEVPAALAGLFPLAAWGFSCPEPTHQHGPAAKHAMEPWHGTWTWSSQGLFAIQQPQISQLHSDFTREEQQWCALILRCSTPLFPFYTLPLDKHRLWACPIVLPLAKAHPKLSTRPNNPQHLQKVHFVPWEALRCIFMRVLWITGVQTGREILQPIFEDRQWLFLLK